MKRSEVVELIRKILQEDMEPRYTDVRYEDTADYILRKLERIGMKAPINKDLVLLRETNSWDKE